MTISAATLVPGQESGYTKTHSVNVHSSIWCDRSGSCYIPVTNTAIDFVSNNLQLSCLQSHSDILYDIGFDRRCYNHGLSSHLLDQEPSNVQIHSDPHYVWGLKGATMTLAPFPLVRNLAVPRPLSNLCQVQGPLDPVAGIVFVFTFSDICSCIGVSMN